MELNFTVSGSFDAIKIIKVNKPPKKNRENSQRKQIDQKSTKLS